ncbi:3,4-dehydroadipyl-CoA semialdehyde dehydrogenase [Pseudenhygromyxa sp. WMMC2535]|uniref:3,4-dehydroadipyl-CoA semialdehyde dehydrogenase n=1 Tax=Pseudenhygromyxa sp. WMMC2535 TaxID=2712867 RepID=UPI0015578CF2|nr:3,4-dehydroadipyl-CoA semialdehyde dehydrogenase [Pseudenhygromyxa sp. WMMC2535]NVB43189.1 3,4-dehydroadipyl-CoA semialdehyde dehydrogenase [Pseudenhygromyxa sp. WMMC2535]
MSVQLDSYLEGTWQTGEGDPVALVNPTTDATVATIRPIRRSLAQSVTWARSVGGETLRAMSFAERGKLLSAMAKTIHGAREELIDVAIQNGGNTRGDAKFDIDGATAVLAHYAYLAKELGEHPWIVADQPVEVFRGSKIRAEHVLVPRHGLAVHINAFNFPAWGMMGKAAVSILAGMPVLSKPATSTAWLAHRMFQLLVEAELVPKGAFSLLMGSAGDLLDHVGAQDVIAFTGSQGVGVKIKTHPAVIAKGARVNLEADSLNAVVIGPDVEEGSELFDLVIRDLSVELTQKAGQKCTATRRVLVPAASLEAVRGALFDRLDRIQIGDPADQANRMGPLTSKSQLEDARAGVATLAADAEIVRGDPQRSEGFAGVEAGQGCFLEPIVLQASAAAARNPAAAFHRHEVFGPVCTLLPYDGAIDQAAEIIGLGQGSLVSTVYSDDREWLAKAIAELGPHLGRLVLANEKFAGASLSPGCVFPVANHGGPGRAGGGEELGGLHGLSLYMQRVAIQGGASQLARLLGK